MPAAFADIRSELERLIKSAPKLTTEGPWRQSGWTLSVDGALRERPEPLVSVRLYEVWTKVLQQRENGWDGESFHVSALFDETKSAQEVANYLDARARKLIDEAIFKKNLARAG